MAILRPGPAITATVLGALACAGCYQGLPTEGAADGSAEGGSSASAGDDGSDDGDDTGEPDEACASAAPAPLRELTRFEYDNTVQDLLHTSVRPAEGFVVDAKEGPFDRNSGRVVTEPLADQYMRAAETLAADADLSAIVGCVPADAAEEAACVEQFVRTFGRRAFRRPLDDARIERYTTLFADARANPDLDVDFDGAVRVVLEAMLQSPLFLHHVEYGDPSVLDERGNVPLTQHELASRLSYAVIGSMPDDALLAAADAGELVDADQLEAHARRLLADPRARLAIARFFAQWLDLDRIENAAKSTELYPSFDDAMRTSMRAETDRLIDEVMWGDVEGTLTELFTADFTWVDARLAALYGLDVGELAEGETVRVDGLPDDRRGLLGHAGFLASHATAEESSPVHRGVFVRDRLMCQPIPLPEDFNPTLPDALPGETPPELVERHMSDPSCAGCHQFFDPIGLGFEHYDGIGAHRTNYSNGDAVDAAGEIVGSGDAAVDGAFDGLAELTAKLTASGGVRDCAALQGNTFVLGSAAAGECVPDEVVAAFAESGGDLRELLIEIVRSEAFRVRAVEADATEEGACP